VRKQRSAEETEQKNKKMKFILMNDALGSNLLVLISIFFVSFESRDGILV
jgi:hypothetical protein